MRIVRLLLCLVVLAPCLVAADAARLRAARAGVSPDFCPALRALVAAATDGFVSLRGKPLARGEHMWEGKTRLPGSAECALFGGTPPAYVCTLYAGDVEANADRSYERGAAGVRDCVPAGWKASEKVDGVHARTTTAGEPNGPRVRVVSRDVAADAYLVEIWIEGAR